jgi:hypothetical protein
MNLNFRPGMKTPEEAAAMGVIPVDILSRKWENKVHLSLHSIENRGIIENNKMEGGRTIKRKRVGKILFCLAAAVLIVGAALVVWQWNNINALRYAATMDQDSVNDSIARNDQKFKDVMEQYEISEHTFSKEELDRLDDAAELEQAVQQMLNPPSQSQEPASPSRTPQPSQTPQPDHSAEIRAQIAKLYVLKATFTSKLEGIVADTKAEFTSLPAEERTAAKKQEIVKSRITQLSNLERDCDQKVADTIAELRRLLKLDGQDEAVAKEAEAVYTEEKSLKKAYYIKELG